MKHVSTALLILLFGILGMAQTSQVVVSTPSMEPGLWVNDLLIVDEEYYSAKPVLRFDIVVFRHPEADFKAVARVIALGGETVALKNNRVFINGKALKEPFKTRPCAYEKEDTLFPCANFGPLTVPGGEVFLLADNRAKSLDSRMFNPHTINQGKLIGKVIKTISKATSSQRTAAVRISGSGLLARQLLPRLGSPSVYEPQDRSPKR
ncbi:MAG TPA: signal peptidase I [Blastocatellia bacterium]|nr:signal peptidase I [Blastocatellia bacterium]